MVETEPMPGLVDGGVSEVVIGRGAVGHAVGETHAAVEDEVFLRGTTKVSAGNDQRLRDKKGSEDTFPAENNKTQAVRQANHS